MSNSESHDAGPEARARQLREEISELDELIAKADNEVAGEHWRADWAAADEREGWRRSLPKSSSHFTSRFQNARVKRERLQIARAAKLEELSRLNPGESTSQ